MFTLINTGMYTINSYLDLGAGVSLVGGWGEVGHKRYGVGGVYLTLQPANGCILPLYSGFDPLVRRAVVYRGEGRTYARPTDHISGAYTIAWL